MDKQKLVEILNDYFDVGGDVYAYNLTRIKSAPSIDIDDFEEFDEETVDNLAEYILSEIKK